MQSNKNNNENMNNKNFCDSLAICNCFQKFDPWLYGKSDIVVHTDNHPPLNKIPACLQRMLMKLQRYRFNVTYKRGRRFTQQANSPGQIIKNADSPG